MTLCFRAYMDEFGGGEGGSVGTQLASTLLEDYKQKCCKLRVLRTCPYTMTLSCLSISSSENRRVVSLDR